MLNVHGIHGIYRQPFAVRVCARVCVYNNIYLIINTHACKKDRVFNRVYRVGFCKEFIWRLIKNDKLS